MKLPVADSAALRAHTGMLLRRHRAGLGRVLLLHTLAATAGLAGPWLLGRMVDAVAQGTTTSFVDQAVGVLVVAVLAQTLLIRYAQRGAMVLGETVFAELREQFVGTVTRLPLSTVERAGTGDLVARTTNDIDRVQHTIRFGVPRVLVTTATIVLTLAAALAVSWQVAVALLAGVPLLLVTTRWYLKRAAPGYLRESASYARLNGTITESVEGARTVDALGLGRRRRERVDADLREAFDAESYTLWLRTVLFPGVDLAFVLPVVATVGWGAWLVSTGSASVGAVTTIAVYALQVMHPIGELIYWLDEIQVGATSLARIIGVQAVAPDRVARPENRPDDEHVVGSEVRYAYRPGHDVLHGVDLDLAVGERLAVVGPSGAGKSTLGRMLAGIHPPTGGTVTVGGVPLVDLPLDELRGHVALVTQEHHVFVGTVEQNLRLAKPDADDDELRRALAAVDADWVDALPDGLATEVGSGGVLLSPAQAQQVALARLVLLDPHTLVLDEATSLLDPRAARHLERSLSAVLTGRTVVAIAHRLHTAHDADRVAVVDAGRITEIGSHDELVAAGGEYAALWRSWHQD